MSSLDPFRLPPVLRDPKDPLVTPARPSNTYSANASSAGEEIRTVQLDSRGYVHQRLDSSAPPGSSPIARTPLTTTTTYNTPLGTRLREDANSRDISTAGVEALRGQLQGTNSLVRRLQDQYAEQTVMMESFRRELEAQKQESAAQRELCSALAAKIEELQRDREAKAQDEVDRELLKRLRKIVKEALVFLYEADHPLPYPQPGSEWPTRTIGSTTTPVMRWNFEEYLGSPVTQEQTKSLVNVLSNHLGSIRLPPGVSHKNALEGYGYARYAGLFDFLIREFFEKWKAELVNRVNEEWVKSGQRDRLVSELHEKQASGSLTYEDEQLGDRVARLDKAVEYQHKRKYDSATTSRTKVVSNAFKERRSRMTNGFSGPAYDLLDEHNGFPRLLKVNHLGQVHWCWPEMEGVMSQRYLEAFNSIKDYAQVDGSSVYGTTLNEFLPSNVVRPEAEFFWPMHKDSLHKTPQRWMFDPNFLRSHPEYARKVAPFDEPTSIDDPAKSQESERIPRYSEVLGSGRERPAEKRQETSVTSSAPSHGSGQGSGRSIQNEFQVSDDEDFEN